MKFINKDFKLININLRVYEVFDKSSEAIVEDLEEILKTFNLIDNINDTEANLDIRFCNSDMASVNVKSINLCKYLFHEHHIICESHTIHNAIIAATKKSKINKLFDKVHDNNTWFKKTP